MARNAASAFSLSCRSDRPEFAQSWLVERIARVQLIHDSGHALQRFFDLSDSTQAMAQSVRRVLARDAQRRAIFHQADVVNVRHLRAADALIDQRTT